MAGPTLEELIKEFGIEPASTQTSGPRAKLLAQADRMLTELDKYKGEDELDGDTTRFWWAPQSVYGKRRVSARYGGKVVEGLTTTTDNTLASVRSTIETLRKLIEKSTDDTWAAEEERRKKK
ncbi:hypothetical protein [Roseobacter sp. AzwK-3b]|uniref:hypothetical protein n=1 Tax=Roseobacter sp. AzwK-3b TaxID=351016 RepID=UPI0012F52295|nr:hypothetical protein [Roseobacter sp. AzwK-3b]